MEGPIARFVGSLACLAAAFLPAQSGWTPLAPAVSPSARGYHGLAYHLSTGRTVLFGGWDLALLGDTWEWNGIAWVRRSPAAAPSARCCFGFAYDLSRTRIVLFGGAAGASLVDMNDTWEWDGTNWTQVLGGIPPPARRACSLAYDAATNTVLMFGGGLTGQGVPRLNDTWAWNGTTWTQRTPAHAPSPRWGCCLVGDWARRRVVMFGGSSAASGLNDTWTWDGMDWTALTPATTPPGSTFAGGDLDLRRNLVVMFDGVSANATWLWNGVDWRLDPGPQRPTSRSTSTLAHDVVTGGTVIFGGWAGSPPLSDTWSYEPGTLATWAAGGTGCAGPSAIPSINPLGGSLPILGSTFHLELRYGSGNNAALSAVGLSDQRWTGGVLPQDLSSLGMLGCWLRVSTEFVGFAPLVNGRSSLAWALPQVTTFLGMEFHVQAMVADAAANAGGAIVSASGRGTIGAF